MPLPGNGEVIGWSEMYSVNDSCSKGIAFVMKHATDSKVVEADEA